MKSNYDKMAEDARRLFSGYDQEDMIRRLSLQASRDFLFLSFAGRPYRIRRRDALLETVEPVFCVSPDGKSLWPAPDQVPEEAFTRPAGFSETLSIFDLLTRSPQPPRMKGEWVSISTLASATGAAPTDLSRFSERLGAFFGKPEALEKVCTRMGGVQKKGGDVSLLLPVYDGLMTWFQYWDADEEFPASVQFLWDSTTGAHLHFETVWYVMDFLTEEMQAGAEVMESNDSQ